MTLTPYQAWKKIMAGHNRFTAKQPLPMLPTTLGRDGVDLCRRQAPLAAVLSCSDSRAPAEIIFNVGVGDLFVIRNAGHIPSFSVLASLEYAVSALEVPLIIVMAHQGCAVLDAAMDRSVRQSLTPVTQSFIEPLAELVAKSPDAERGRELHLRLAIKTLLESSEIISERIAANLLGVAGVEYFITSGLIRQKFLIGPLADGADARIQTHASTPQEV